MKRNLGFKHLFFRVVMCWTYKRSRDKEKRTSHNNDLDLVRLAHYAKEKKAKWTFVNDGMRGLLNYIIPPVLTMITEEGDCDDYASCIVGRYEVPTQAFLLTYFPKNLSRAHTVALVVTDNGIHTYNWGRSYFFSTLEELLVHYEKYADSPIISYHIAQWNEKKFQYQVAKLK